MDLEAAKNAKLVRGLLEIEMDLVRASKASDILDQEAGEDQKEYLGYEGEKFSFDHLDNPLTFHEICAKENVEIGDLLFAK